MTTMIELTIDFNMIDEDGLYIGFTESVVEVGDTVALVDLEGTRELAVVKSVHGDGEVRAEAIRAWQAFPIQTVGGNTFTMMQVGPYLEAMYDKLDQLGNKVLLNS